MSDTTTIEDLSADVLFNVTTRLGGREQINTTVAGLNRAFRKLAANVVVDRLPMREVEPPNCDIPANVQLAFADRPFADLQNAINRAADGDTILVKPGNYGTLQVSNKRITLHGYGANFNGSHISCEDRSHVTLIGLMIHTVLVQAGSSVHIHDAHLYYLHVCSGARANITHTRILNKKVAGVLFEPLSTGQVRGCSISDSAVGVQVMAGAETFIYNNVFIRNTIGIESFQGGALLRGNVFKDNAQNVSRRT